MGMFLRDEYHTHGGREMGCIVREVQRVERVARPRVVTASVRARRPGQPPETDYELHETIVHWRVHHFSILRAGMICFIHAEERGRYRGVFINSIAHDRMMVTRVQLSGTPTHFEVTAEDNQVTWDAQEVNSQESLEALGQLARWEGPMVLVALGTAAAFIVGFGPAAGVVGLGAPAATSTLTISILNSALSNALVTFIHANYRQMFAARQSGQVAHFWRANSSSLGEVLRATVISGATNAVTGGLFHTPHGTVGFEAFLRHILGRVGNAFASILNTVITERTAPDPPPSESVIRRRLRNDLIINLTFRMLG